MSFTNVSLWSLMFHPIFDTHLSSYFSYLLWFASYSPWLLYRFLLSLLYLFCLSYCSACLLVFKYCPLSHLYILLDVALVYSIWNMESFLLSPSSLWITLFHIHSTVILFPAHCLLSDLCSCSASVLKSGHWLAVVAQCLIYWGWVPSLLTWPSRSCF